MRCEVCIFFPFLFLFVFYFHWESFLLWWLHWDKQQRNLIKWMPGVMTLSKHAAALSINQRMFKKKNSDLAAYEYWWALNAVWMEREGCVWLCERLLTKEKRRQVSRTMATYNVVLVHIMGLACDDSPSAAVELGDPSRNVVGCAALFLQTIVAAIECVENIYSSMMHVRPRSSKVFLAVSP